MTKTYALYLAVMAVLLGAGATWMFGLTFTGLADAPDTVYLGLQKAWLYPEDVISIILILFFTLYFGWCGLALFLGFGQSRLSMASGFIFGVASWFIIFGPLCLTPDNMFITPGQKTVFVLMTTLWLYVGLAAIGHYNFCSRPSFANKTYGALVP